MLLVQTAHQVAHIFPPLEGSMNHCLTPSHRFPSLFRSTSFQNCLSFLSSSPSISLSLSLSPVNGKEERGNQIRFRAFSSPSVGGMGSKGGVAPPPSVVCCMCGDHGLAQELFRCKVCLVRCQHKYCSDLYPKAQFYGACNWCLREEGAKSLAKEAVKDPNTSVSSSTNNDVGNGSSGSGGVELHHRVFSSQLHKPIKRPKLLNRSASDVTDRSRSVELSPGSRRARQAFRGKVRRYKLLEEFSS